MFRPADLGISLLRVKGHQGSGRSDVSTVTWLTAVRRAGSVGGLR